METTTNQSKALRTKRAAVIDLKVRGLKAQTAFLGLGIKHYTPHVMAWAAQKRVKLPKDCGDRIRQCVNGNARVSDTEIINAIEATLKSLVNAA